MFRNFLNRNKSWFFVVLMFLVFVALSEQLIIIKKIIWELPFYITAPTIGLLLFAISIACFSTHKREGKK